MAGLLGEDQAHGTGTKGEFVNTAQRGLRDAVIRGTAFPTPNQFRQFGAPPATPN